MNAKQVCDSKRTFATRRAARASRLLLRGGKRFKPYRCWVCGMIHLTTRKGA
jgi:hypothetical protein